MVSSGASGGRHSRQATQSFAPLPTGANFKDLLIFEERLKQNSERLQKQRRKYEAFLVSLVGIILYLAYTVFVIPSIYSLVHYGNVAMLLVSLVTLVLFFVSGMYSEKIAYAYKFVPQANRALRPFNIYLNTRTRSRFHFLTTLFRSSPPPTSPPTPTALPRPAVPHLPPIETSSAPLSRKTSTSSTSSISSARSSGAIRSSPPSPVTRSPVPSPSPPPGAAPANRGMGVPLAPIPPAQNPRGELIFSSRVSAAFREGYERYRGEWEKRRLENAAHLQHQEKGWFARWGRKGSPGLSPSGEKDREGSAESDAGGRTGRDRTRSRTMSTSSRPGSRQSSPFRRAQRNSTSTLTTPGSSRSPSPVEMASSRGHRRTVSANPLVSGKQGEGEAVPFAPAPSSASGKVLEPRVRATSFSQLLHTMEELEGGAAPP